MNSLRKWAAGRRGSEAGVATLEFMGMLPILLFITVVVLQAGVAGWTASSTAEAARAAARAASLGQDPNRAARNSLPGSLRPTSVTGSHFGRQARYTVAVPIPGIGFLSSPGTIRRTVTMPDLVN